ncbi:MAG: BamA/TamA family outer membrane protein [Gloeomargarita sp. SKYG116]|nr:BamA/TamA family outer membrane protein [Gloeomargarita sp. SKYG116]MCS7226488.1 BamA/TamA family outer membrane protein [Gloeomargarita sp. SKYB31]MDW8400427.1 BamA/TamA family outer membrane protein [Gloeomargarita sp. SKYGB_i_bin116]
MRSYVLTLSLATVLATVTQAPASAETQPLGASVLPTAQRVKFSDKPVAPQQRNGLGPIAQAEPAEPEPRVLVAEVLVEGAEGALLDAVYGAIRTRPGFTTTRTQLQRDIDAIFATGWFQNVQATPEDTPLGVRIRFVVQPNPVLKQVNLVGVKVLPQQVADEVFTPLYGEVLNFRSLQQGIQRINEWYKKNGYPLGQVVGTPKVDEQGVVTLEVAEGVIADIRIRYLNAKDEEVKGKTKPYVIIRELQQKPGDVFNEKTAQRDLQTLFGLGVFEDVRLNLEPSEADPRKAVIVLTVVEARTGAINFGAGYSTATGFFGSLGYSERNLGGRLQSLNVNVQGGERDILFDVNFRDPWLAFDPGRLSLAASVFNRRSFSYIFSGGETPVDLPNGDTPRVNRLGAIIDFSRPFPGNWRGTAGISYQRVSILDGDNRVSPVDELGNFLAASKSGIDDLLQVNLGATKDERDNPLDPTRGWVLRLGYSQALPVGSGNISQSRLRASYSHYIPVKLLQFQRDKPEVLAFNIQAGTILGRMAPYEAFSLGGTDSVRGWGEGELGTGRSFLQATAEYRFPIFNIVRGALFVDYGTTLGSQDDVPGNPGGIRGKPGQGLGYGIGIRLAAPFLGNLRIDFGWNDRGGNQITFGVGERF